MLAELAHMDGSEAGQPMLSETEETIRNGRCGATTPKKLLREEEKCYFEK